MKFSFTIEDGHLKKYNAPILGCDSVATVPEGVSAIDASAFYYIRGLDRVELPESVQAIGEEAFYMCEGMRSFGMPSRLKYLGARAFAHCHSLESIVIPEGVETIPENAFYQCERLEEVYLPRSLTDVQPGAFYGCYLLTKVYYAGTKAEWEHVRAGALIEKDVICLGYDERERERIDPDNYTVEDGVLIGYCGEEATVFLPEGVHTVGSGSFYGLYRPFVPMRRLVLHEGVTRVEAGALCQEDHLSEIVIPRSLTSIPEAAFCPAPPKLHVIYRGTRAEWAAVRADMQIPNLAGVTCTDGEISMKYKSYLFDFDGTLVNSMPFYAAAMLKLLDEHSIPYGGELIKTITPLGYLGTARYYVSELGLPMGEEEAVAKMKAYAYEAYAHAVPAKATVEATLRELKARGADLHVLTASPHEVLDVCLTRLGLCDLFTNVWSCDDFGTTKADPDIYRRAAERIGRNPSDVLFLDDNPDACRTARAAGMPVCAVFDETSAAYRAEMTRENEHYVVALSEILDL